MCLGGGGEELKWVVVFASGLLELKAKRASLIPGTRRRYHGDIDCARVRNPPVV